MYGENKEYEGKDTNADHKMRSWCSSNDLLQKCQYTKAKGMVRQAKDKSKEISANKSNRGRARIRNPINGKLQENKASNGFNT